MNLLPTPSTKVAEERQKRDATQDFAFHRISTQATLVVESMLRILQIVLTVIDL